MSKRIIPNYRHLLLFPILLLVLSSCGFSPVYKKEDNNIYEILENIEIVPINSIYGAELYNQLKNILPSGGEIKYKLEITHIFIKDISIIQENSDILRERFTINVSYNLKDVNNDDLVTSGSFSRLASFNTTYSPYSNSIREQDIQKNLAIMSAEEIRNRIIMFMKNQNKY